MCLGVNRVVVTEYRADHSEHKKDKYKANQNDIDGYVVCSTSFIDVNQIICMEHHSLCKGMTRVNIQFTRGKYYYILKEEDVKKITDAFMSPEREK